MLEMLPRKRPEEKSRLWQMFCKRTMTECKVLLRQDVRYKMSNTEAVVLRNIIKHYKAMKRRYACY